MYEQKEKRLILAEDELRKLSAEIIKHLGNKQLENQVSTYGKNAIEQDLSGDTYRKKLDNLQHKVDHIEEEVEQLKKSKESHRKELELKLVEFKRKVDRTLKDNEEAHKNAIEDILNKKYLMEKPLIQKLEVEVTQMKNKLSAYEKQWKDSQFDQEFEDNLIKGFSKELNSREEIFEKRINKVIDEQLKIDKEVLQKELQLKIENLRKGEAKKRADSEEAQRTELHELQLKIKQIESCREETNDKRISNAIDTLNKQLKDSEEAHRKELHKIMVKIEQIEREKLKEEKENISALSTEKVEIEDCKSLEEQNKEIDMLKRDNEQLKLQLDLIQKTIASKEDTNNENIDISISDQCKELQELVEYISLLDSNNARSDNTNTEDDQTSNKVHIETDTEERKEEAISNGVVFIKNFVVMIAV